MVAGLVLNVTGICPIVKRIWTPSWTLYSGGVCFLFLAAFTWFMRSPLRTRLAVPLVVVGMNSIAAYLIAHLWEEFLESSFRTHLGMGVLNIFGAAVEPFTLGLLTLATYWLVLYWMYRRKVFLRI
jgi:predicted acyltransferase